MENNNNLETPMSMEELLKQIDELKAQVQGLTTDNDQLKSENTKLTGKVEELVAPFEVRINNNTRAQFWKDQDTFKGHLMYCILTHRDTSSRIDESTISNCLDNILIVAEAANALGADDTVINFADQEVDIRDLETLDIIEGAYVYNEVSETFDNFKAYRYKPTSVLSLGISKGWKMPTKRQYVESLRMIKNMHKYMKETFVSLSSLHNTTSVSSFMKECAHKYGKKFYVASRDASDRYFIPSYVKELNDKLLWKNEYYNEFADTYVDLYFDKFVVNVLRGKRD